MSEMNTTEINRLLDQMNTGVLALCSGREPYSIPVSYRYGDDSIFIKLGYTEESRKMEVLGENDRVSFTVYDVDEETESPGPFVPFAWRSVVVTGELREVESEKAVNVILDTESGPSPKNPWGEPRANLDFTVYEIEVDEISGRKGMGT